MTYKTMTGILISYMPGSLASWYRELYNVALLFL